MTEIDSNIIDDALANLIDVLIAAGQNMVDQILDTVGGFAGNFVGGDLTANTPALLCLVLVMVATGGILGYKLSRG